MGLSMKDLYYYQMQAQQKPNIQVINFKRIQPLKELTSKRFTFDSVSINVVLVEIGGTSQERRKLRQCEQWIKSTQEIRLMKINKSEAFESTYRLMMKQSLPVYFIMMIPIEQLNSEPIYNLYKNELNGKSLNEINQIAKDNISRIKFIIIHDQLQKLKKISFLHSGVHLVTTSSKFVIGALEEHLQRQGKMNIRESTSSINTIEMESFAKQMEKKISQGVNIPIKKVQSEFDAHKEAWKLKNNTPGVGTYNV